MTLCTAKIPGHTLTALCFTLLAGCGGVSDKTVVPAPQVSVRAAPSAAPENPAKPDFSGTWVLNAALSDDPRKIFEQAKGQRRGGGAGMDGGGMRRGGGMQGGGMGRGHPPGGGRPDASPRAEAQSFPEVSAKLSIEHREPFLSLTDENGQTRKVFTDYRGVSVSASGGAARRQTIAGWEGNALVLETAGDGQPGFTETYELKPDTRQLWITIQAKTGAEPAARAFRRVYEAQSP